MALVVGATRITLDGQRAIDCYDAAPFTVARQATLAEQVSVLGTGAEVLKQTLTGAALPSGHAGTVGIAGSVITVTITA